MKYLGLVGFVFVLVYAGFGQTVKIEPKTVTYSRPKPIMDFKKTFSVTYPKVSGTSRALAAKIERSISYKSVLGLDLEAEMTDAQWLEEATYEVVLMRDGVLSIELTLSGSGAYPSVYGKNVVVDLRSGNRVTPRTVFSNLRGLVSVCRKLQKAEIESAIEEIAREEPDFLGQAREILADANFTERNLDWFSVRKDGVEFEYRYGFPHVAKAFEPAGRFLVRWNELRPFIRRNGLLAKFVR